MSYIIVDLYSKQKPFVVIISNEINRTVYSVIFKEKYIKSHEMNGFEINYFLDIRKEMKLKNMNKLGSVWEYKEFRSKMSYQLRHNFLVRNEIIKNKYI